MKDVTGQILRLKSSVTTDRFKDYNPNGCLTKVLQLRHANKFIVGLDLRSNALLNQDLLALQAYLSQRGLPKFKYLLLNFNRFDPTPEAATAVLSMLRSLPRVTSLPGNPLSTISDSSVLFNELTLDETRRFVFALGYHIASLRSESWRFLFEANRTIHAEELNQVLQAHLDFSTATKSFCL
eukprot:TRINITY_DN4360_c0_g1_i1.p1 TRINITY_DN4360_c0_g1~~TRINITY_DN4360_c0_g1_i1.p1  ORF type:complete len:182 (+),score=20.01 TRINITY_DN4360_c0_g1_i1:230-775(+)